MYSTYDKNGNVIQTTDALGNVTKTEYDELNRVIKTIDAKCNTTLTEYDAYDNVIKTTDALQHTKQKKFNVHGLLEMEIDERGFSTKYTYNDQLQVTKIENAKGNVVRYEYNDMQQLVKQVDTNGGITTFTYDAYGRVISTTDAMGKTSETRYDALGNAISEKAGNKHREHIYDERGNLLKTFVNEVLEIENTYNELNQVIETKDANGNISTYEYDVFGNVVNANEKGTTTKKEYNVENKLVREIQNDTYVTEYTYNAIQQLIETKVNGKVEKKSTYDVVGNETEVVDNGITQRKSYDAMNHQISLSMPDVNGNFEKIIEYRYDESGNVIEIIDAAGHSEKKTYDAYNNIISETNRKGIVNTYEYDSQNNMIKAQNADERYVTYEYDKANQQIYKMVNDKIAEYEYDLEGNLIEEKDEYGMKHSYTYNARDELTSITNPDETKVEYTYDNLGNVLTENDRRYTYDERGNQITASNAEGTVTTTYDAFDNIIDVTDTNGKTIHYTYDKDNRISSRAYGDMVISYTYTENNQLKDVYQNSKKIATYSYDNRGQIIQIEQGNLVTKKNYDRLGHVIQQQTMKDSKLAYNVVYEYDENDNLIKEEINNKTNTYRYNDYDELKESQKYIEGVLVKTTYAYDIYGNRVEKSSDDQSKTYHYNDENQIERIDTEKGSIRYRYDANGNISHKVNEDGKEETFLYDDDNQLIKLQQGEIVYEYSYDANKERIREVRTDLKDYHYDRHYTYNEELKVVSDKAITNVFEDLKQQAEKKEKNQNSCVVTKEASEDVTYFKDKEVKDYLLDRNMEYTQIVMMNEETYIYGNALLKRGKEDIISGFNDSVVAETNQEKLNFYEYRDYGSSKKEAGKGYNGEWKDESGLLYLRARYYDTSTGQFIQIDNKYKGEQEKVGTQNRYVYALNNPYKYVDRDGEISISACLTLAQNTSRMILYYFKAKNNKSKKKKKSKPKVTISPTKAKSSAENRYLQGMLQYAYSEKKTLDKRQKQIDKVVETANTIIKKAVNGIKNIIKANNQKNKVPHIGSRGDKKNVNCSNGYWLGNEYYSPERIAQEFKVIESMIDGQRIRYSILTSIAKGFLGAIKDTFNVFARYISDPSLIITDFKRINWERLLTMAAGGAFAGIMLLTCGASIPIIFAGYGVGKQLMGVTYDVIEYGGIDNLLKATDCKDIFEYGGNQLFYLAINTYSGYKAGQRLKAARNNRANKKSNNNLNKGASGAGLNKKLMNELAESGVKYNVDDVVMITKTSDGKLLWLEKGNGSAGLKHIVDGHAADFAAKGVNDIPKFLSEVLKTKAVKVGTGAKGPFAEYIVNGTRYRVAYGTNGYIVSFYPID